VLAADHRLAGAVLAVAVAATLDALDGLVARRLSCEGGFGRNLDSLADLVAFAVAPALMLLRGPAEAVAILGPGVCLVFVLASAWRLARFPLVGDRHHFVGLPVPPAGLLVAATALLAPPAWLALALTLVLALLMVSAIPFPTLARLVPGASADDAAASARFARSPDGSGTPPQQGRGGRDGEDEAIAAGALPRE
jgi:CDP-diacylglycerol--serine O-phosphatidyltransferase